MLSTTGNGLIPNLASWGSGSFSVQLANHWCPNWCYLQYLGIGTIYTLIAIYIYIYGFISAIFRTNFGKKRYHYCLVPVFFMDYHLREFVLLSCKSLIFLILLFNVLSVVHQILLFWNMLHNTGQNRATKMFENRKCHKVDTISLHRQRHLIIMGHIFITTKSLLAVSLKLTVSFKIYQMYHNISYQNE